MTNYTPAFLSSDGLLLNVNPNLPPQGLTPVYTHAAGGAKIARFRFSPQAQWLGLPVRNGRVQILSSASGTLEREFTVYPRERDAVLTVDFSPDGQWLAAGGFGNTIWTCAWTQPDAPQHHTTRHTDSILTMAFDPQGEYLVSLGSDHAICYWTMPDMGPLTEVYSVPIQDPFHAAWSPCGRWLAVIDLEGQIFLLNRQGRIIQAWAFHLAFGTNVVWSWDSAWLASSAKDQRICIRDPRSGRQLAVLEGHTNDVLTLGFSRDNKLLVSKSRDHTVRFWRTDTWTHIATLQETGTDIGACLAVAFHPFQDMLVTLGTKDRSLRCWHYDAEKMLSL